MSTATASAQARPLRRAAVPNGLLGMLIFIVAELMAFAGALSAFTITRTNSLPGMWPPPGQPRLPAGATAWNTALLLASGACLAWSGWRHARGEPRRAGGPLLAALLLGGAFVGLQGREWWALLAQGLTLTSSALGSFFYLIVGGHALHAVCALAALAGCWWSLRQGRLTHGAFVASQAFWYFVVVLWPVIYLWVYF